MAWKSIVSYWSVMGLTIQSSRWEQAMNQKLLQMAQSAAKSAELLSASAENKELSMETKEKAAADQAEATELEEEATLLFEKSEADAALAAAEEIEMEGVKVEIAAEEEESAAHAAAAALDEVSFESEMTEGTADATEAARMEARAHGEEIGIGACEFVPFLDIVCDFVGGVTAVGLEVGAATEAAKASSEFAAAAAAKMEEEREVALVAEIQAKALEDGALASELQGGELETEELAEEERLAAEEKQAAAEALFEEAEVEADAAAEESALSAEEEAEANSMAGEAISHGVLSCWNAIMASICGVLSFVFFAARTTTKLLIPAASQSCSLMSDVTSSGDRKILLVSFFRYSSLFLHHCALFGLVAGVFQHILPGLEQLSLRSRGGIILCFGILAGCIQTPLLHTIPRLLAKSQERQHILLHATRQVIILTLLSIIEILILWVAFGPRFFSQSTLHVLGKWWLWIVFIVLLTFHILYLEIPMLKRERTNSDCKNPSTTHSGSLEVKQGNVPTESDRLLPIDKKSFQETINKPQIQPTSYLRLLHQEIKNLQLPFEALILSCMIALLLHCSSSVQALWPASKALLLSSRPGWLIPLAVGFTVIVVAYIGLSAKKNKL